MITYEAVPISSVHCCALSQLSLIKYCANMCIFINASFIYVFCTTLSLWTQSDQKCPSVACTETGWV